MDRLRELRRTEVALQMAVEDLAHWRIVQHEVEAGGPVAWFHRLRGRGGQRLQGSIQRTREAVVSAESERSQAAAALREEEVQAIREAGAVSPEEISRRADLRMAGHAVDRGLAALDAARGRIEGGTMSSSTFNQRVIGELRTLALHLLDVVEHCAAHTPVHLDELTDGLHRIGAPADTPRQHLLEWFEEPWKYRAAARDLAAVESRILSLSTTLQTIRSELSQALAR